MNKRIFPAVYYVETKTGAANPLAIRPEIGPHYAAWEDTGNGRSLRYTKVMVDDNAAVPEEIEVMVDGDTYRLTKLTLSIFQEKLKDRVAGGSSLHFESDQALQDYYLNTDFRQY